MARKIENCYRCITAERIQSQHPAALDIQTACRCSVQCKKYGRFLCSRMIQSWWRGRSVRAPFIKYMTSRKIQTAWRCKALSSTNNPMLPDRFRHRGDERSDSVRLQTSLLLDDCKRGGELHHSGNHISGIWLLDGCSRPGEECCIQTFIKFIWRLATLGWKKTWPQPHCRQLGGRKLNGISKRRPELPRRFSHLGVVKWPGARSVCYARH
jgi:hypothetical protein